jgi:MFS family permease
VVEETADPVEGPLTDPAPKRRGRVRRSLLGSLIAFINLVFVLGAALLTMVVGGMVLHAITPHRTLDVFRSLHEQFVVGTLLGLSLFWLLPPHPWMNESEAREVREPATSAGETGGGDVSNVTTLSEYRGREPSRRPRGQGEVAG